MKKMLLVLTPIVAIAVSCATDHQHAGAHSHIHGTNCGHLAVTHDGHTDYLDTGHLHHIHAGHYDDHVLAVNATNPDQCTPGFAAAEHATNHIHGVNCGHSAIPHGNHVDYVVDGHLHHLDGDHCDDHGPLIAKAN